MALWPLPKRRDASVLLTELPLDPPGGGCGSSRARSTGTRRSAAPTTWPSTRSCRPRTWSTTRLRRSGSSLRRRPDAMTARRDSAPRPLPPLSPAVPWASGLAHAGVVLIVHKINIQTRHTLHPHPRLSPVSQSANQSTAHQRPPTPPPSIPLPYPYRRSIYLSSRCVLATRHPTLPSPRISLTCAVLMPTRTGRTPFRDCVFGVFLLHFCT